MCPQKREAYANPLASQYMSKSMIMDIYTGLLIRGKTVDYLLTVNESKDTSDTAELSGLICEVHSKLSLRIELLGV